MIIILTVALVVVSILALVGWGQYFRANHHFGLLNQQLEIIKQLYMTTVFTAWHHLEFLEEEHEDLLGESTVQNLSSITNWSDEESEDADGTTVEN